MRFGNVFRGSVASLDHAKALIADEENRIPSAVRQFAREHFHQLLPDPHWLYMRAEIAMLEANLPRKRYEQALVWAEVASGMAPENELFAIAVGTIQYRLGRYEEAIETLGASHELRKNRIPDDLAVLAMVYHALGNVEERNKALDQMKELMKHITDSRYGRLCDEALKLAAPNPAAESGEP